MFSRHTRFLAIGFSLVSAIFLMSCIEGGNSSDTADIFAVAVSDNNSTATMEVSFRLSDNGTALSGVAASSIRFTVVKLLPAASPRSWESYINTLETKACLLYTSPSPRDRS